MESAKSTCCITVMFADRWPDTVLVPLPQFAICPTLCPSKCAAGANSDPPYISEKDRCCLQPKPADHHASPLPENLFALEKCSKLYFVPPHWKKYFYHIHACHILHMFSQIWESLKLDPYILSKAPVEQYWIVYGEKNKLCVSPGRTI